MKTIISLFILALTFQLGEVGVFAGSSQTAVSCERIDGGSWYLFWQLTTCMMNLSTKIESPETFISHSDSSVAGLNFQKNKNIIFLPIGVDKAFKNLLVYNAIGCSIRSISKNNFRNLKKLQSRYLRENQIEIIDSDTFEDLKSIERISLGSNNIKQIDGIAFAGMKKLKKVWMIGNVCINKDFELAQIVSLAEEVDDRCSKERIDLLTQESKTQLENQKMMLTSLHSELKSSWESSCKESSSKICETVQKNIEEIERTK